MGEGVNDGVDGSVLVDVTECVRLGSVITVTVGAGVVISQETN